MKQQVDVRLVGETSENIFLSLVNQRGVFCTAFDTEALDGIAYDFRNTLFVGGVSPCYFQVKCRGSKTGNYNSQGHSLETINKIRGFGSKLGIVEKQLYFTVGFFKNNDIRTIKYFIIPFNKLDYFKGKQQYRFSVAKCKKACDKYHTIIEI
jgi:hypothetical protein